MLIRNLNVSYDDKPVLHDVHLQMAQGESATVMGPSGCGKTTLLRAILGRLPVAATVTGELAVSGGIAIIHQQYSLALHPLLTVGAQVEAISQAHGKPGQGSALLNQVGVPSGRYPHQLSGGEQQRAVIARALAVSPRLLLADEPTASLDSVAQRQILDLLMQLRESRKLSILFVTHSKGVARYLRTPVLKLQEGRLTNA